MTTLTSTALESLLFGVAGGMVLTIAVMLALRLLPSLNAATRAVVWSATLAALPCIPLIYFASHFQPAAQAPVRLAEMEVASRSTGAMAGAVPFQPAGYEHVVHGDEQRPWRIAVPAQGLEALLAGYFLTLGFLLIRLLISYLRLRLLRLRTQPAPTELAVRLAVWLRRCPTRRRVELRISNRARSPLAMGFLRPVIVMPADLVLDLSREEYDDLGVHELAHLRRYDDWTNLIQRVLQAVLCFHPAAYFVGRKLNLEREIACDDWVVSAREGECYARCLAKVVELRRYQRGGLLLSTGAFFGKRQLVRRVELLLDKTRNGATSVSVVMAICCVVGIVAVAGQVIHLPAVVAFTQDEAGATTSSRWSDGSHDLRIKLRGEVIFSDDEQSVKSLSPDGFFIIDEARGWDHRRLEVRANQSGVLEEKYFVDGREKPLDGVGRAWAASNYLFALRDMGMDAEGRVRRIFARKGTAGVFEEISLIRSDHVKCEYLRLLMEQTSLSIHDLQRVADSVRKVSSDNDKADFLIAHDRELNGTEVRASYFSAVNSIQSDNDRRRVLTHLLASDGPNPETVKLVGQSAKLMNSDNDKAEVLLASSAAASGEARCVLLSAARTIQSDNDKARVLHDAGYVESAACRDEWFAVVNLINSDNDRANALQGLLQLPDLQPETYRNVAYAVKGMNSDNDKANVLVPLSKHYADLPFFESMDSLHSDNDRGRVLKAVLENKCSKPELLAAIGSAAKLNDDNEKTGILVDIAKQSNEPEVRTALQKVCEKLNSDNDYRRLASALFMADAR